MADKRTIDVYNAKARDYAALVGSERPDTHLKAFIDLMPDGGRVLDLGCGPAAASNFMRAAGLIPDATDASPEMVKIANDAFDIGARVATFDQIEGVDIYDGIWANFSLLHAPRDDLPAFLTALFASLKPNGFFHIGMKTGSGAKRDGIDRLYTYVEVQELQILLRDAGLSPIHTEQGSDTGLDGVVAPWVICRAQKNG